MHSPFLLRRSFALALLASASLATSASAQAVLDDFSTDLRSTSYTFKSGDDGRWRVFGGLLDPVSGSNTELYSGWIWSGGETLNAVGDSFPINLHLFQSGNTFNGGLAVWKSNTSDTVAATDRIFEPRLSGSDLNNQNYQFTSEANNPDGYLITDLPNTNAISPLDATLSITLTDRTATDTTLTAVLSGEDFSTITHSFTFDFTGPLFVGPSTYGANGVNVSFDNLTYSTSAVPEPSTYAALAGLGMLGFAMLRRRRQRA